MIKKNQKYKRQGFTLIEVLVFVSIFSLFFIVAATVTSYTLRNLKNQENKILATRYAEELAEWLKGEKEKDWNQFVNRAGTYCFKNLNFSSPGNCNNNNLINGYFKREATLTLLQTEPPNTQMKINITVKWIDSGGQENTIPINTIFTIWE